MSNGFVMQQQLAAHLRDPQKNPAPVGCAPERVALYRRVFFNNIESLLARTLPRLHALADPEVWLYLVRGFYAQHPHSTPYFMEIAGEFADYLAGDRERDPNEPGWLTELAHFEWARLALETDSEPALVGRTSDLEQGVPRLQSATSVLAYDYPVHVIYGDDLRSGVITPSSVLLVLHRDPENELVCRVLTPLAAQLLAAVSENTSMRCPELVARVARQTDDNAPTEAWNTAAMQFLNGMREAGIIVLF